MIQIGGRTFEVLVNHKNGWNPEVFRERYSEVLDKYDYIVGDWGYNQLRLKGFWPENHAKATKDNCLTSLEDYLIEHCNFGCAYFVLKRVRDTNRKPAKTVEREKKYAAAPSEQPS